MSENTSKTEIKISVREMVEFLHRGGDLDARFTGRSRAHEGTKAHQHVQKEQKEIEESYESEVTLSYKASFENIDIVVSGRADGVIMRDEEVFIDEIKSTLRELDEIEAEDYPLHWMQGKCYGYFYCLDNELEEITIQLTYVKLKSYDTVRFTKVYTFEELKAFFDGLIEKYLTWAEKTDNWKKLRNKSIKELEFPFGSYRNGQKVMAKGIYKSIKEKKKIFVQAPTGIGKTISSLFPAIKALGEEKTDKLMYLTAKTITRTVAEDTLKLMLGQGLRLKSLTLTAKDKVCFEKGSACTPDECSYAKGHFNRVNDAIDDIIDHEDLFDRNAVVEYAEKHHVCPFEFSLDLALFADCTICDYNYVFDPKVYLKRFFDASYSRFSFLIDEAHNLVGRSREMFSAEIFKQDFLDAKRLIKGQNKALEKNIQDVNKMLLDIKKEAIADNTLTYKEPPLKLYPLLRKFTENAEKWLTANHGATGHAEVLDLFFSARSFINISELYDDMYVTYLEMKGNNVKLKLFCAEPSRLIGEALKRGISTVFFSATLIPMDYFKRFFCYKEGDYTLGLQSPFDVNKCKYMVGRDIATTYKKRERDYGRIAQYLMDFVKSKEGNYIAFFSSYKYMNEVYEEIQMINRSNYASSGLDDLEMDEEQVEILAQSNNMNEIEREEFLERFEENPKKPLLGLCVLGGIFSEGIDLRHDRLIGTAIIGVGLPMVCLERELIKEHHENCDEDGFLYAYVFPGVNKVLQAAGRVIRTEQDEGVVLLLDERYYNEYYRRLLPYYWNQEYVVQGQFERKLREAWEDIEMFVESESGND